MAYGTYQAIINAIADNLGKPDQPSIWLRITKDDIFSEMCKIYRKIQPIKAEYTAVISSTTSTLTSGILVVGQRYTITSYVADDDFTNVGASSNATGIQFIATGTTPTHWVHLSTLTVDCQNITLPSDFFLPLEVVFSNSESQRFPVRELQYEEYLRWNPNIVVETSSFTDLVTNAVPVPMAMTEENAMLDGLIGYVFSDTNPIRLKWKPAIDGVVQIFYAVYPTSAISDLTASPDIHTIYQDLIVLGVTIQQLTRRLTSPKDQIELFGLQTAIKRFGEDYQETLKNFGGYVNTNTSAPIIQPFDFMNDYDMFIPGNRRW
ncbi:MAG: hypothetical protein ACYC2U_04725 [Candidatus Amoebophilus sp.]